MLDIKEAGYTCNCGCKRLDFCVLAVFFSIRLSFCVLTSIEKSEIAAWACMYLWDVHGSGCGSLTKQLNYLFIVFISCYQLLNLLAAWLVTLACLTRIFQRRISMWTACGGGWPRKMSIDWKNAEAPRMIYHYVWLFLQILWIFWILWMLWTGWNEYSKPNELDTLSRMNWIL